MSEQAAAEIVEVVTAAVAAVVEERAAVVVVEAPAQGAGQVLHPTGQCSPPADDIF